MTGASKVPPLFRSMFKRALMRLTRGGGQVVKIAPTVPDNYSVGVLVSHVPSHTFSMNVTRKRTIAFSKNVTGSKLLPFYGVCSSFVRQTCSGVVRSMTVRGLGMMFYLSHTKLMNRSNPARRNIFSVTCLHPVPGLAVSSPVSRRRLQHLVCATRLPSGKPFTVHCPHKQNSLIS